MGNFLKYEISTEPQGPQTIDYARKAALPSLLRILVMMVDPAWRAEINNCTPLCDNLSRIWDKLQETNPAANKGRTTITHFYLI
jgi:hypothetical protein